MAIPSTPTNFYLQQGNAQCYALCGPVTGATSYPVFRSIDNVSFSEIAAPSVPQYLDTTVIAGTLYYYSMAARNSDGTSAHTASQDVVPVQSGQMTLAQLRLQSQQRADRVNSQFLTLTEWNTNINQSAFELYDLLTTTYEDYYVATPYTFQTTQAQQYAMPNGVLVDASTGLVAKPFYKLMGVDLGLSNNDNGYVTLKKFEFIGRNRYVYPQVNTTPLGVFNFRYRLVGNNLMFIPAPSAGQYIRVWYYPRMQMLLQETDVIDGISGWEEFVVIDAAIKALQKEESDVSVLMAQKMAIIKRIQDSSMNRDEGQPETISNSRSYAELWGGYGPNGDGNFGGL